MTNSELRRVADESRRAYREQRAEWARLDAERAAAHAAALAPPPYVQTCELEDDGRRYWAGAGR